MLDRDGASRSLVQAIPVARGSAGPQDILSLRSPEVHPAVTSSPHRLRAQWLARLGIPALLVAATGCAGGVYGTPEALEQAKRLWTQAQIRDYDLDWTVKGPNNAHYFVTVRGGEVRRVESVQRDGSKLELHPGEPRFFSVDGLFLTIADEIALLETERPFGQPKGTKVVMRFEPESKLGYPHWYRRDVLGTQLSISIEVNRLIPAAATSR
jgi:hypothetical protein